MKIKRVLNIKLIFCVLLNGTSSQYSYSDMIGMEQFQFNPYKNPLNIFQNYPSQMWNLPDNVDYEEYNDSDEGNTCSCENCEDFNPLCRNMCPNCAQVPAALPNPGYVFLPFPYPYPTAPNITTATNTPSNNTRKTTVTTTETTTTEATTQKLITETRHTLADQTIATTIDKIDESKVPDVITKSLEAKDKSPYMLTSLRRTKPNWIPKYGIVPISNKFAEKLMLQLRSMKVLHPRKDYLRDVDEITPNN